MSGPSEALAVNSVVFLAIAMTLALWATYPTVTAPRWVSLIIVALCVVGVACLLVAPWLELTR